MREGEGSILGTFELKKLIKIDMFVSLCDNSAHKRAGKLKTYTIVKNYMFKCGNTINFVIFFKTGRNRAMFRVYFAKFVKMT